MSAADPEKATAAVNLGIRLSAVASVTSCDTDMPVSDNKVISTMGGMCAVDALCCGNKGTALMYRVLQTLRLEVYCDDQLGKD